MSMVFDILEEEKRRLERLIEGYRQELSHLPKGAISRKRRWKREYLYLAYRDSGKVKFDYVGPADSEAAIEIARQVRERRTLQNKLDQAKQNLEDVERGLRGRR
jgi:hypothetical protein